MATVKTLDAASGTVEHEKVVLSLSTAIQVQSNNTEEIMNLLAEKKVDINAQTQNGITILSIAVLFMREDLVRALLAAGANVQAKDKLGVTVLFSAARTGPIELLNLLVGAGAVVNECDVHGSTPLHGACEGGPLDIVQCLLSHGASVNAVNEIGEAPIHLAMVSGETGPRLVDLLVSHGADITSQTNNGRTPLHYAAYFDNASGIELLLRKYGVNVSSVFEGGLTALDLANMRKNYDAALVLQTFIRDMSEEWRPSRHSLYPDPFCAAVAATLALWSWNANTQAPWHPESPFVSLSLELLFEVFIWLAANILTQGCVSLPSVLEQKYNK